MATAKGFGADKLDMPGEDNIFKIKFWHCKAGGS